MAQARVLGVDDDIEFQFVVAVDDLGVGKPDPRVYAEACRRFGLPAGDVVYVGDDVARDAVGGTRPGRRGRAYRRLARPLRR